LSRIKFYLAVPSKKILFSKNRSDSGARWWLGASLDSQSEFVGTRRRALMRGGGRSN